MLNLIVASTTKEDMLGWLEVLQPKYPTIFCNSLEKILPTTKDTKENYVLIINTSLITEIQLVFQLGENIGKVIVVGDNLTNSQKIEWLYAGAIGYSEKSIPPQEVLHVIKCIGNNEAWLERKLIPYILEEIGLKNDFIANNSKACEILTTLTHREIEVLRLIYNGQDNSTISKALDISIRTVKAHLTAIYAKLNVDDRFHLVVLLKNLETSGITDDNRLLSRNWSP